MMNDNNDNDDGLVVVVAVDHRDHQHQQQKQQQHKGVIHRHHNHHSKPSSTRLETATGVVVTSAAATDTKKKKSGSGVYHTISTVEEQIPEEPLLTASSSSSASSSLAGALLSEKNDNENDEEEGEDANDLEHDNIAGGMNDETSTFVLRYWQQPFLPDHGVTVAGMPLIEGAAAVRLLKFAVLTVMGIVSMFYLVRWVGWENHQELRLRNILLYDGNFIVTDLVMFFVVGRLYRQKGVDHAAWIFWVVMANLYTSGGTSFAFFRHSVTLYEMHCTWPAVLWIFLVFVMILVITVIVLHVRHAVETQRFFSKLFEMALCVSVLLLPQLTSPYFHFHHWFAGWLVGMHCNYDVWWSRAAMAWCWGCYINGIAVYGRDPMLTCGYSFYVSNSMWCPYMECYWEGINTYDNETNQTEVEPMVPPDWRNCSADIYHA